MNNDINKIATPGDSGLITPPGQEAFVDAIKLLKQLISTQSFSKEEGETATILENFFKEKNIKIKKRKNAQF